MKRIMILVLTLAILFISVFGKYPITVDAADSTTDEEEYIEYSSCYCVANALTWQMLQTFLFGIAGQQAYDTYANDSENQAALYSDFCDWWETQKRGTEITFTLMTMNGAVLQRSADKVFNYYKTAGTSALADVKEKSMEGWSVIKGGLNENDEKEPEPSPTPSLNNEGARIAGMAGIGTLIGCMGGYIKDLINGERGEVSDTFNNVANIPLAYFGGNYAVDGGYYEYSIFQNVVVASGSFYELEKITLNHAMSEKFSLPVLYLTGNSLTINGKGCYETSLLERNLDYCPLTQAGNDLLSDVDFSKYLWKFKNSQTNLYWGTNVVTTLYLNDINKFLVKDIPIFDDLEDIREYWLTGNAQKALNYFNNVDVEIPSNWLDYQMANIAQQLQQILQALATLPVITTDDLAGFAAGISAGIAANNANIAAMTQDQLQQFMTNLNMESAKNVAAENLVDYSAYDGSVETTPKPTTEPYVEYKRDNGKMMVDLSKFFPFCVPYDMVHLIKVLNAEPKAPKFETCIKYQKLGINEKLTLDLSSFNDVAKVFRLCETLLFILGLILLTRNIIRG